MPKRVAAQINGTPPCPLWTKVAGSNVETVWLDCNPHIPPKIDLSSHFDLVLIQCAVRWFDLQSLGWDKLTCPIVASVGDASVLCNTEMVFKNLSLLSRLYVEGYDYVEKYLEWCQKHEIIPTPEKLVYQQLCADNHFHPTPKVDKLYDWCFLGQAYPLYDVRLKHYRRDLIPQLLEACPEAYVSGPGWQDIIGSHWKGDWIDQSLLNGVYSQSRVVVSIDAHDGTGYTSTRTIEAMHAGHCTFIYDHPGMGYFKKFIKDGEHAVYFNSVVDFKDKLQQVKADPQLARRIGAAGRQIVLIQGWTATAWMRQCLSLAR